MKRARLLFGCLLPLWLAACGPRDPESVALTDLVKAGYTLSVAEYHRAAAAGDTRALGLFLESGIRIDVPHKLGENGVTALRAAVSAGQAGAVNWLLERGANVPLADNDRSMPLLRLAVASGSEEITRRLLGLPDLPPVPLEPLLRESAAAGAAGIADALLEAGPALELGASLRAAAAAGHLAVVDLLLQKGALLDETEPGAGGTALMRAAAGGHAAVVRLLLDAGASRWYADHDHRLAADLARAGGHEAVVTLLWHVPDTREQETGPPPAPASEPPPGWLSATAPAIPAAAQASPDQPRHLPPLRHAIVGHHSGFVKPPPPRERLELHRVRPAMLPLRLLSVSGTEAAFEVAGMHGPPVHVRAGGAISGTGWRLVAIRSGDAQELPEWVAALVVIEHSQSLARLAVTPAVSARHGPLCAVLHIAGSDEFYEGHPGDVFRFTDSPAPHTLKFVGQLMVQIEDESGVFKLALQPRF